MTCKRCGYNEDPEKTINRISGKGPDFIGVWICPKCKKAHFIKLKVTTDIETFQIEDSLLFDKPYGRQLLGGTIFKPDEVVLDKEYTGGNTYKCIVNGKEITKNSSKKPDITPGSITAETK